MQLPNISSWRAKWTVGSLLGKGAFAAVFPAVPPPGETHKMPLVVKVATDEKGDQMISEEENAYNNLRHAFREALQGVPVVAPNRYIPDFEGCWRTTETPRRYFLVLERLHAGLDDYLLAEKVAGRWNSPVIKDAALQMFDALSALSLRGYAHRDVKLENFGVRKKDNGVEIVLFDLGMTTLITAWELEKASRNKAVMGTIPFLSIRAAERYIPVLRDDVESLCYCLFGLCTEARLPWPMDGSEASRVLKEKQRLKSLVSSGDRDGLAAFFGSTSPLIPAIGLVLKDIQAKDWNWKPTAQDLAVLRARLDAVICEPEEPKIPAPNTSADQQATPRPQREASGDYNDNIDNTITTKRKKRDGEGRDHAAAPRKRARKSLDQQAIEEGQAFLKSPAGEIRRSLRTRNRPDRS